MIHLINGHLVDLSPDTIAQLEQYQAWPRWRRWAWRHGLIGRGKEAC